LKNEHESAWWRKAPGSEKEWGGREAADVLSWFLGFRYKTVVVIACDGWKSGKPAFGFPLFQAAHAKAVEM